MPGRRDEVDQRLAARLAWSTEVPDDETLTEAPPTIDSPEKFESFWEAFQAAIQRTLVSPADVQPAAYVELMRALASVLPQIGALPADAATTRLARLHLRLREAFPRDLPYSWVDVAARLPVEPNSPESLEFLLEAVHCRDALVVDAIDAHLASTSWSDAFPGLAAKLLPLLPTLGPHARRNALSMLARGRWPEARPLLRDVLRGRSLHERTLVLHQFTRHQLVTPEMAAALVLDLSKHPRPPETRWEYLANLVHTNALRNAVHTLDSPALREAAHRLVRGPHDPLDTDVADFGTTFGLTLLAPFEPEFVLDHLRHLASSLQEERRWNAVAIAPFVPAPQGPLWLAELARDPSVEVSSAARDAAAEQLPDLELLPRRLGLFVGLVAPEDVDRADEELARVDAAGPDAGPLLELLLRRASQAVPLAVLLRWMSARSPSDLLPSPASADHTRATVGSLVPRLIVVAPARKLGHGLATLALHDPWLGASVLDELPPDVARAAVNAARKWIGHPDTRRAAAGLGALERVEATTEEEEAVLNDLLTAPQDRLDALLLQRRGEGKLRHVWDTAIEALRRRAFAVDPPDFTLLRRLQARDAPFESHASPNAAVPC